MADLPKITERRRIREGGRLVTPNSPDLADLTPTPTPPRRKRPRQPPTPPSASPSRADFPPPAHRLRPLIKRCHEPLALQDPALKVRRIQPGAPHGLVHFPQSD